MAFFDDISKKITDVTSSAAQKTRDMTEISRLNSAVNEEEAKINNAYLQIGRLYCANHSNDCEESFAIFVNAVKESEKRIADIKAQIRDIKGIVTCPTCGENVSLNVAFCSNCGTPTPKPAPTANSNTVICPQCGNAVAKGMRFCTSCGFRMPEMAQQPAQVPVDPQPAYVPQPPVQSFPQQPAPQPAVPRTEPVIEDSIPDDIDLADASKLVMGQQNEAPAINLNNVDLQDTYSPARAPVQQPQVKTCSNCGKVLTEGMVFCTECGARV